MALDREGPLHGFELEHLRKGHVLLRHTRRYPVIMLWLCSNRRRE